MSNLDFNVQLTMATAQFNQAVNMVVRNTSSMQTTLSRAIQDINTNTTSAGHALTSLMNTPATNLIAEVGRATQTLNSLGAGARLNGTQVSQVVTRLQSHITNLSNDLSVARANLHNLQMSGATVGQIANAQSEVNRLRGAITQAQSASNELASAMQGALGRVTQSTQTAQNAIYGMLNIRTRGTIQNEISRIQSELNQLRQSGTLTRAELSRITGHANARLRELRGELGQTGGAMSALQSGVGAVHGGIQGLTGAFGGLAGLLGGLGLVAGAKELITLAEAYKSVEAQVRVNVGEGEKFVVAMNDIKAIANETRMPLEETANLFARINRAGKEMGLSMSDVSEVTMTINKAMQVTGGSASSMNAALIQLIQGLQSGVLRGEEFNSVMEQSPRLARALADGLGVSIGELRTMANEGKLTSEVVIGAIKSQTDVINAEFAKMPTTVGGSLTVLKNKFMEFVGGIDKELQQTSAISDFIMSIGNAFDNIDQTTTDAIKETFSQLGGLAKQLLDNFKMTADNLASVWNAFDGTEQAGEQVGFLTKLIQALSIGIGYLSDGVNVLATGFNFAFGAVIGAVGATVSAIQRLMGVNHEFADSLVSKGKEMMDKAHQNVLDFESKGQQAREQASKSEQQRLDEVAQKYRQSYEQMSMEADKHGENAKYSAEQVKEARVKAIEAEIMANGKVVSAVHERELAELNLQAVISKTGELSFKMLDESVNANEQAKAQIKSATKALEIDTEEAMTSVSKSFGEFNTQLQNLIKHYDVLKTQGLDASDVLVKGLENMTEKAKNTHDLEEIIRLWKQMGGQGKISGEQMAEGLKQTQSKLDEVKDGVNSVTEAYKRLGLQSKADLKKNAEEMGQAFGMIEKSGTATADTLAQAWKKQAEAQILANDGVASSALQAQAKLHGFTIQIDKNGKASIATTEQVERAVDKVANRLDDVAGSASGAGEAMSDGAEKAKSSWDSLADSIESAKNAEQEAQSAGKKIKHETQFGTATGIENFLKQAGVDDETAMKKARHIMSSVVNGNSYEAIQKMSDGMGYKGFRWAGAGSHLLHIAEQLRYKAHADKASEVEQKVVNVNIKQGGQTINTSIPANQENAMMEFLKQLENGKALSGR